jgi:hypothetical protein
MQSFITNGHSLLLHVYEEPRGVPSGVKLANAADILPVQCLFRHCRSGSIAPFADWFRYRLLFERGGIWADTDVVCLAPWNYPTGDIYGWMDQNIINNAVLGLTQGHPLAKWMMECCENPNRTLPYDSPRTRRRKWKRRYLRGNRRNDTKWGESGPDGFTQAARHLGYAENALPFWHFYPIHYLNWHTVFDSSLAANPGILGNSRALHLWNEMTRLAPAFDKNARFPPDSLFERLCERFLTSDS